MTVEVVHRSPADGSTLTACCVRHTWDLPEGDRVTVVGDISCPVPAAAYAEGFAAGVRSAVAEASGAGRPLDPDCRDGKHRACVGTAWDERFDHIVDCACECHAKTPEAGDRLQWDHPRAAGPHGEPASGLTDQVDGGTA